jgi:phosphate starvation-inducible PhoH-like protein
MPKRAQKRETTYKNAAAKTPIELKAITETQEEYINALHMCNQLIVFGPAGTGKTYVAATYAAKLFQSKDIDKIIITRPHVPVGQGEKIGFLPGTLLEKVYPWALPVLDILEKHLGKGVMECAIKNGNIEMVPLALIRGRSFENAFIIVDEAQNTDIHQIKTLLTRVGEGSQIVLDGDIMQSDIKEESGLSKIIYLARKYKLSVPVIEFGINDIVRSDICRQWIEIFMEEGL